MTALAKKRMRNRAGFALPMALLVMIVLTAGITAGYQSTSAEIVSNAAHRGDNKAYNIAEAGLEKYMATRSLSGLCATGAGMHSSTTSGGVTTVISDCLDDPTNAISDSEWVTISMTGGYADVKAVMVRPYINDTLQALYFVRSVGTDTSVRLTGISRSLAGSRGVGLYAEFGKTAVNVKGAWFALSGLTKNGAAGSINGVDQCATADGGGKPSVAGAVVPAGQFSGNTSAFAGSPAIDSSGTFSTLKDSAKLDWAGMVSGSAISADFEITATSGSFPDATWFANNPNAWPIIHVKTNGGQANGYSLPVAGRGMIIADSNFQINGSNMWDGIVLIGGALHSNGTNTTAGATFAGLNYLLGGTPGNSSDDSDANGTKTYVYNSCNVAKASAGLRVYKPRTNTWLDNVPVW